MTWQSISDLISPLRERRLPLSGDLRQDAALLATLAYGRRLLEQPALVNFAALAISMSDRLIVHRLAHGAVRAVAETDLHSLPGEPPQLLRGPWILESRSPEEPLFGATAALAGYPLDDAIFLLGLDYPDGVYVARWTPHWEEREISVAEDDSPLIADVDRHREWAREAARFVVVLSLLLESEGSPVEVSEERQRPHGRGSGGGRSSDWVVRRVHLGRIIRSVSRPAQSQEPQPSAEERQARTVPVRGHIKRQPYGPGRSLRRWIYVESYEARRWISPKPLRIEVSGKEDY